MLKQRYLGRQDGKILVQTTGETAATREMVRVAKDLGWDGHDKAGELGMRLTHRLPMILYHKFMKESGYVPGRTTPQELDEYIGKRLATGEFDNFKVYEGTV